MRFDNSIDSLNVVRSESVTDLNSDINNLTHHTRRSSIGLLRAEEGNQTSQSKPFGIGKYSLLLFNNT